MTSDVRWVDSMPEVYDRALGPALFEPYAEHLAQLAAGLSPRRVLELAAGTGLVTSRLVDRLPGASITATDLNAAMVGWAASRVPGVTWLEADAQHLDFPDSSFDLVVCQFGVMFFPDKRGAFAEAARVLAPGAAMVFSVWDGVEYSDSAKAFVDALSLLLPDGPPSFLDRIPYGYTDVSRIRSDVEAGGLAVESIERVELRGRAASARAIAEGFVLGTPLQFELEKRGDLNEFVDQVGANLVTSLGPGPVDGGLAAYVVTARNAISGSAS